jgi:uncharacterized membrane protein YkvA (DUF1232 family)
MDILDTHTNVAPSAPDTGKMARDERVVNTGFWPKIRATLGKVPFTEEAVAAYYCATDRATPTYVRAVLFGALAYFVIPTDLIPDFIVGLGFTDDATVLLAAFSLVRKHFTPEHQSRAKVFLMNDDQPDR